MVRIVVKGIRERERERERDLVTVKENPTDKQQYILVKKQLS